MRLASIFLKCLFLFLIGSNSYAQNITIEDSETICSGVAAGKNNVVNVNCFFQSDLASKYFERTEPGCLNISEIETKITLEIDEGIYICDGPTRVFQLTDPNRSNGSALLKLVNNKFRNKIKSNIALQPNEENLIRVPSGRIIAIKNFEKMDFGGLDAWVMSLSRFR